MYTSMTPFVSLHLLNFYFVPLYTGTSVFCIYLYTSVHIIESLYNSIFIYLYNGCFI